MAAGIKGLVDCWISGGCERLSAKRTGQNHGRAESFRKAY